MLELNKLYGQRNIFFLITGNVTDSLKASIGRLPFVSLYEKPFDAVRLVQEVRERLKKDTEP